MALEGKGDIGSGGWGVVDVGAPTTVVAGDAETLRSREEKRAAAAAAPVSADTPATTAKVVFDILTGGVEISKSRERGRGLHISYTNSQHRFIRIAILVRGQQRMFRYHDLHEVPSWTNDSSPAGMHRNGCGKASRDGGPSSSAHHYLYLRVELSAKRRFILLGTPYGTTVGLHLFEPGAGG